MRRKFELGAQKVLTRCASASDWV